MSARMVEDHAMLDAQNSARSSLHNACSRSIINDENVHPSMEHTEELDNMMGSAVCSNLFEERPLALNSLFRFQLGSDIFDGYEFAREAWKRVVGNEGVLQHEEQTLKSLRHHKDLVKRELKLFEVHFSKSYGRPPSRLDKECLRRLYEFHKQLKAYIQAEEVKEEMLLSSRNVPVNAVPVKQDFKSPRLTMTSSSSVMTSSPTRNNKQQILETDIKLLKLEKRALKIKLRRFEDDFIRQNGHKPQSYHEVGSIRADYSRYKILKEAVSNAGGAISSPSERMDAY